MHLILLELTQQVINLFCLRYEVWRTDKALPSEVDRLREMRQQVFDIQYATNIVLIILINRDSRVVIVNDALQNILVRAPYIQVNDILPGGHNLLCRLITEAYNALQHALLILDVSTIGEFQGLLQVIDGELVRLLLYNLFREVSALQKDILHRPEQFPEQDNTSDSLAAERQWVLTAVDLWHNLTKEKQEECEKNSNADKFKPGHIEVKQLSNSIVQQHDNRHVDKVVGYQYCSQRALTVLTEHLNFLVSFCLLLVQFVDVAWRKTEECYLRTTCKTGEQQQKSCKGESDNRSGR